MVLAPPDRKLLARLKEAQCTQNHYVVVDPDSMMAFPATGYYREDVMTALSGNNGVKLNIDNVELSPSLEALAEYGFISRVHAGPVYQVTHAGWYNGYVRRAEIIRAIVTHVAFPSLVAFITTLITVLLTR